MKYGSITKTRDSFTLIELLIVVAIIGILAAIAVPNFLNAQTRSKLARVYADLKAESTALEMYYLDWNAYPLGPNEGLPPRLTELTTPLAYISTCPIDPFRNVIIGDPYYHYAGDTDEAHWLPHNWGYFTNNQIAFPGWIKYVHRSLGPDYIMNHSFPFEISNGLYSTGDIVHWGPGPVTDHNAYQHGSE